MSKIKVDNITLDRNMFNSLTTNVQLLLDLFIVRKLEKPSDNLKSLQFAINTANNYYDHKFSFIYNEEILKTIKEYELNDDLIYEAPQNIINGDVEKLEKLEPLLKYFKESFINDFRDTISLDLDIFDEFTSFCGKELDFILDHASSMNNVLELIKKSNHPNLKEMEKITYFSFSRTIATYVDDTSNKFIKSLSKINHLHSFKLMNEQISKNKFELEKELIEDLLSSKKKGIGYINSTLSEYFSFPKGINRKSDETYKKYLTLKEFVERRNKITHNFEVNIKEYDFIIKNWNECLNLFPDIIHEYTLGKKQNIFIDNIINEANKLIENENYIFNYLFPIVEKNIG